MADRAANGTESWPIYSHSGASVDSWQWPDGIKGSLAHDPEFAVAAVSADPRIASIGVDVEPAQALPEELTALVIGPADNAATLDARIAGKAVFAAKEAIYKATHPIDGLFLEFSDAHGW